METKTIPKHIAIIMDGNGRWAQIRGLPRFEGHKKGVETVKEVVRAASDFGVKVLSLYAFSLENWMRPEEEVSVIMELLKTTLEEEFLDFMRKGIRFRVVGNRDKLSQGIRALIEAVEEGTADNKGMVLQCALSYGGRDEIIRALKKAMTLKITSDGITEECIGSLLDTAGLPDPDLIIRTSGEQRLSNFLLWQSAYAEFYFTNVLWPDFTRDNLLEAINEYQMRDRRFGRVTDGSIRCP